MAKLINYDLAVLILDGAAPEGVEPISLAEDIDLRQPIRQIVAVGFGSEGAEVAQDGDFRILTPFGSGKLRTVDLQPAQGVTQNLRWEVKQTDKGICYGDSGGPALIFRNVRWIQVGVASFVSASLNPCHETGHFLNLTSTQFQEGYGTAGTPPALWIQSWILTLQSTARAVAL